MEMGDHVLLVMDFDNVCRLCLSSNGAFSDIFKKTDTVSLGEQILRITGLNSTETDGLPRSICHKCRYIVETAYELRETVQNSKKLLNEAVLISKPNTSPKENVIEKLEELDDLDYHNEQLTEEPQKQQKVAPKNLTCQICLCVFSSTQKVNLHAHSHYTSTNLTPYFKLERPYRCEQCGSSGLTKLELVRHHREHLGVNPFECKESGCSFVGKDLRALRLHGTVHGSRDFICPTCGASFKRRWSLENHEARLHRANESQCKRCGARCRNEVALTIHLRTHERPRKFSCPHPGCGRSYLTRGHLEAHVSAHAADRRYRCPKCSAAYTSASLLNRHMKQHQRKRLWQCGCGARYSEYGEYYTHRREAHGDGKRHRCPACRYGYKSKEQLDKHLERCEPAVKLMAAEAQQRAQLTMHESPSEHGPLQVVSDEVLSALAGPATGPQAQLDDQDDLHDLSSEGLLFIQVAP